MVYTLTVIPLTRGNIAVVDHIDSDLSKLNWHTNNSGYAVRHIGTSQLKTQVDIFLHRQVVERMINRPLLSSEYVDHIDGDTFNNSRNNLRVVSGAANAKNRRLNKNSSSGLKGVTKAGKRWRAQIQADKKKRALGTYDTPQEAYDAYCKAAEELHGEYARFK